MPVFPDLIVVRDQKFPSVLPYFQRKSFFTSLPIELVVTDDFKIFDFQYSSLLLSTKSLCFFASSPKKQTSFV